MIADQEKAARSSKFPVYLYITCGLVFLYVTAFGPMIWSQMYFKLDKKYWIRKPTKVIFYPHFWLMARSEGYFTYSIWWVKLIGNQGSISYEQYNRHFENW